MLSVCVCVVRLTFDFNLLGSLGGSRFFSFSVAQPDKNDNNSYTESGGRRGWN